MTSTFNRWATIAFAGAAIAATLPAVNLSAQADAAPGQTMSLSLAAAVQRGFDRNEDIGSAKSLVRGARAQTASVRAGLFPQLGSQLSYQRTLRSAMTGVTAADFPGGAATLGPFLGRTSFGQRNSYGGTLDASQVLFDRQLSTEVRAARKWEDVQQLTLTEQQLDVSLQIVQAYYDAVLSARVADISAASVEQANQQLNDVQLAHQAGKASALDVMS